MPPPNMRTLISPAKLNTESTSPPDLQVFFLSEDAPFPCGPYTQSLLCNTTEWEHGSCIPWRHALFVNISDTNVKGIAAEMVEKLAAMATKLHLERDALVAIAGKIPDNMFGDLVLKTEHTNLTFEYNPTA